MMVTVLVMLVVVMMTVCSFVNKRYVNTILKSAHRAYSMCHFHTSATADGDSRGARNDCTMAFIATMAMLMVANVVTVMMS